MSLTDYTYWLKAKPGDTAPTDEKATGTTLTGGTIALVDRGTGDVAWQFSGGQATTTIPSFLLDTALAGAGMTVAFTIRVTSFGTLDHAIFVGVGNGAMAANKVTYTAGLGLAKYTDGSGKQVRAAAEDAYSGFVTVGNTVDHTVVLRFSSNASTYVDYIETWIDTPGRTGTAANGAFGGGAGANVTVNTISIAATNGAIIQIKDMVVWPTPKTSAEAANIADTGIRSSLSAASALAASVSYTETNDISAIAANMAVSGTSGYTTYTETNDVTALSATASAPATGTVTTGAFKNNTGSIIASLTALTVTILGVSNLSFVKTFTAQTTNVSGVMVITDALLVSGTQYIVVTTNAAGTLGVEKYTAV